MSGAYQRDAELSDAEALAAADDAYLRFRESPSAGDVRGRLGTDQQRAGAVGYDRGIDRVIVMRMVHHYNREAEGARRGGGRDLCRLERLVDRSLVGRDGGVRKADSRTREEAVDQQRL